MRLSYIYIYNINIFTLYTENWQVVASLFIYIPTMDYRATSINFISHWFDSTGLWTHDLPHVRPVFYRFGHHAPHTYILYIYIYIYIHIYLSKHNLNWQIDKQYNCNMCYCVFIMTASAHSPTNMGGVQRVITLLSISELPILAIYTHSLSILPFTVLTW